MTRVGSLCTGYGGIEMGLRLAGVDVDLRWLAENDPALTPLHGEVANLGDLRAVDWSGVEPVDLLTAGFPCQPVSAAGRQRATADDRWLWPHVRDAVKALAPERVLIENVRNLVSIHKGELWRYILADLNGLDYRVRWLTLGACHVGAAHHRHRVFALATRGRRGVEHVVMPFCGAKGGVLLPTSQATDGQGGPRAVPGVRTHRGGTDHGPLLPTPSAASATGGRRDRAPGPDGRIHRPGGGESHGISLDGAVQLLPTPRATDGVNGGPGQRGSKGDLAMPSAVQPEHWGRFAAAVARHESLYGPAPAPTEPNRNGAPRLAPAFAEWLMCLPAGHVTSKLDRAAALRVIGNGVCPPQLAAAWEVLNG